jgi:hypothetical protein
MNITKHKNKKTIFLSIIFLLLVGCSSSSRSVYKNDYQLTNKLIYSADLSFGVLLPYGWTELYDNECNCNNILVVSPDYMAAITITPIILDKVTSIQVRNNPTSEITQLIKATKQVKIGEYFKIIDEETINSDSFKATAFRYTDKESLPQRTVIVYKQNKFFEVDLAITSAIERELNEEEDFYNAQNSILKSLILFN